MSVPERLSAALADRYAIERELGAGGMATVYLADDLKHERKVALKVLKPELAAVVGAERFLAEIRTTANLQHPHVLPLFDSGEADGFLFYVMPYVQGETLRDRLDRERQLSIEDAVALASKVADALDYAHEQGVVHRDIKPGNILLSPRGDPLVADFGIALAVSQAGGGRITETGLSMGTPHYMSPEQATGDRDVDPRSDVYALGCVLYEMLVGQPPFAAATAQGVLARILTESARDPRELRHTVPDHVAAVLARALEKTPADRFPSAAAFREKLGDEGYRYEARTVALPAHASAARPDRVPPKARSTPVLAGVTVLAVILAVWGWLRPAGPQATPAPPTRLTLDMGDVRMPQGTTDRVEVSPDGSAFAVVAGGPDGIRGLYVRRADEADFRFLDGTVGAFDPAFSPEGDALVFETEQGTLARVPTGGGGVRTVVPAGFQPNTPFWADDGYIYFGNRDGILRVPEAGGEPDIVLREPSVRLYPTVLLPGGRLLATERETSSILLVEGDSARTLLEDRVDARYLESGHLLFADAAGGLWAAGFDAEEGALTSTPTLLFDDLTISAGYFARYSLSQNGTLVYSTGVDGRFQSTLMSGPEGGPLEAFTLEPRDFVDVAWSPDGRRIAYASRGGDGERDIYVYDSTVGSAPVQITVEGDNRDPVWAPDGTRLAFRSRRGGLDDDVWIAELGDSPQVAPLFERVGNQGPSDWPTENMLVFSDWGPGRPLDLWTVDPSIEDPDPTPYLVTEFDTYGGRISPAGDLIAYVSDEFARSALVSANSGIDVFVRSFPDPGPPIRISSGGGGAPRWSADGGSLYYLSSPGGGDVTEWVIREALLQRSPVPAVREVRTALVLPGFAGDGDWDFEPASERVVVSVPAGGAFGAPDPEIAVVTNWFEELARIMEGGR